MSESKVVVLYHDDCVDGLTSGYLAWKEFGSEASYYAVQYGKPVPCELGGKDVFILDFCYPAQRLVDMVFVDGVSTLTVLDHHKTAQADVEVAGEQLKSARNVLIRFDMDKSGAGLTADHFNSRDWWVDYVEDRDLWRFKLPNSESINAFIQSVERTFEAYDAARLTMELEEAHVLGLGALRYLEMYTREVTKHVRYVTIGGYPDIPVVNAPFVGISEVVGSLAKKALFAVGWSQRGDGKIAFSLRSSGDFDVSELAKAYGGGGHKGAAGFTLPASLPTELQVALLGVKEVGP
jgi:uncharacterized protein